MKKQDVWNEEIKFDLGKSTETGGKYAFLSLEKLHELNKPEINKHTTILLIKLN